MRITIDLDDQDLKHFRLIMKAARGSVLRLPPEDIVANAEYLLAEVAVEKTPRFVRQRLAKLELMIGMLMDHEWRLPKKDTIRVLNALAYFTNPEDLIPDHVPGIGYLDDAIMIELVVRDLRHELEAYADFREFRRTAAPGRGVKSKTADVTREDWLDRRRKDLQARMRRRRKSEQRRVL
jgi:uncharacterized membrane protein YkvA (DUF1232 family)